MKKILLILVPCIGLLDTIYLTYEHFSNFIPPCSTALFVDCGKVLQSSYATQFGIPVPVLGIFFYGLILIFSIFALGHNLRMSKYALLILSIVGFIGSIYFVYLQLFVIQAVCLYCIVSAIINTTIFFFTQIIYSKERKMVFFSVIAFIYQALLKRLLFKINPEIVHNHITLLGERLGKISAAKYILGNMYQIKDPSLTQKIANIEFPNPIGLSAGFDYEAQLTQILSSIGFGFQTVGTITNMQYNGNPGPMLGRLPESKSLMVNKGFKNKGASKTISKLSRLSFEIPVGISIGRTNSPLLKTQKQSIADIIKTFIQFEESCVKHSYYELNISCPNLYGDVTFYPPENLEELLKEIDTLDLKKPLFIKMPISTSSREILDMLEVIEKHSPIGVIFGNLQKDKRNPAFVKNEINKFTVGNFSGKPTYERSNKLIHLTYKNFKNRFVIVGCGGVFSGRDAYTKITLGASLIQLITGMIFQGPQLISQINIDLIDLLKKDGLTHISQAVGSKNV